MRNLTLLLLMMVGTFAYGQQAQRQSAIIPIEDLTQAADYFAGQRWGNVGAADPIPYYDPQGNIIAYGFNYAIDKQFPAEGEPFLTDECDDFGNPKNKRWGVNEYAHLVMGNNLHRTAMFSFIAAMSDEHAYKKEIREMAASVLGDDERLKLDKIYFQSSMLKYYKYTLGKKSAYVRIFPPAKVLTETEFQEEYVRNFDIDQVSPMGSPEKWAYYLKPESHQNPAAKAANYIPYQDECVPFLDWHYGCSPTAGGMLLGYWDNYSDYSGNNYGNLSKHHFYEYGNGGPDYNVSTAQEKCAVEMGTNYNTGGTSPSNIGPGVVAAANSSTCGSYNFSQSTTYYDYGSNPAKWNQQRGEINADRPWHCGTSGHSTTAIGYEVTGGDSMMIIHNTWYPPNQWWNYTLNYRISEIYPGGAYGSHVEVTSPNGDPDYNHNGNGEIFYSGTVNEITWDYDYVSGAYCRLLYSVNGGDTWIIIDSNTPCDGTYLWNVPSSLNSTQGRIKVEMYSSGGTLIASDGSWGNFSFVPGSAIITLQSDGAVNTTADPTYYQINHTYSTWGAVGVRTNSATTNNWSMLFYDSNTFSNQVESSTTTNNCDFVVFDQHHLTNAQRGIKVYQFDGTGDARTEFEGYTETLTVGTTTVHTWPADDVVEIWDVYLSPGTYKFSMEYNSGSCNLDMALFSSYGTAPEYQSRGDYVALSSNSGTSDESFFVTIDHTDHYGFIVWSNDANSANVDILVETTTAGLWVGGISTNWHTSGNWSDNNVPTSATEVVIPSGTTYSPLISTADAYAKSLHVESGATLTFNNGRDLDVDYDAYIYGTIEMNHYNDDLYTYDDCAWYAGSQVVMNANAEFHCYGSWFFKAGADVQFDDGKVYFDGTNTEYIECDDADCYFNDVYSNKTGGAYMGVSYLSDADLTINGNLNISSGSAFNFYSQEKVIINGSMNNNGGHFLANYGTVEFAGIPASYLEANHGDYFNNLEINVISGTSLELDDLYSDSLVVKGDLTISDGNFDCNNVTITCGGDWLNTAGTWGFYEHNGEVIFDGDGAYQYCYGETFYDLQHNSGGSKLLFHGPTNITNNYSCSGQAWAYDDMEIDNLNLGFLGKFVTSFSGTTVNVEDLDMGYTVLGLYMYGTVEVYDGQMYVDDLADNALYGSFKVHGSTGLLDITQGTTSLEKVHLNGTITIEDDGTMNVHGGYLTSYWPYSAAATVNMSSGVLDFDNPIQIHLSSLSFTENITGGTIRTASSFTVNDEFAPSGGTIEMYGSTNETLNMNYAPGALHNLHINKTSGQVSCFGTSARISNNLVIDGGTLVAPDTIYIGGDWENNVGTNGFDEDGSVVYFYGSGSSEILTDETFEDVIVDKTYSTYNDVVQTSSTSVTLDGGDMKILEGTYEIDSNTEIDIDGDLTIYAGGGFNANDGNIDVFLGGSLMDYNTTIDTYVGLAKMYQSTIDFTFDGTGTQYFNVLDQTTEFGNMIIDKTENSDIFFTDDFRVNGDFTLLSGDFLNSGIDDYYFEGDFTNNANGNWFTYTSPVHFEGGSSEIDMGAVNGHFGYVEVDKNSYLNELLVVDEFRILGSYTLNINTGKMVADGTYIIVSGDININADGELNMTENSVLRNYSGMLKVNSGGVLELVGTYGNEILASSNNAIGAVLDINVYSGGTIAAEYVDFSNLASPGVAINPGAVVNTSHPFSHCSFSNGESGGGSNFLTIGNSQSFTVEYAHFPDANTASYNVYKSSAYTSGNVTFENATGVFAGEAHDYDPNNLIDWTSDLMVTGIASDVSCNGGNDGGIDITIVGGTPSYTFLWNDGNTFGDRSGLTAGTYTLTVTDLYGAETVETWYVNEPGVYTVWATAMNVSCYGGSNGSINISLSGGTYPDYFLWNDGVTTGDRFNLTAGTYTLTCTDVNGCITTGSWTISEPNPIIVNGNITHCSGLGTNDGAINISGTGGTPLYTFAWSTGATSMSLSGLVAGTYSLTLTDANGCTVTESYTVNDGTPPPLTFYTVENHVLCNGDATGTSNITVTSGVSPFTYNWSHGETTQDVVGLTAGTYTVTVGDAASQTASATIIITEPTAFELQNTFSQGTTCPGGTDGIASVTAQGGVTPYSYVWNTMETTQQITGMAGVYTVTCTDANACTFTASTPILDATPIQVSGAITHVTVIGGNDGAIDLTATHLSSPLTYSWSNGATTEDLTGLSAGTYTVTVTNQVGCSVIETFTVNDGTVGNLILSGIVTHVTCNGGNDGAIDLTINGGTNPYSIMWSNASATIDQNNLSAGIYTVTVTDFNSQIATASFTVTEPSAMVITETYTNLSCNGGNDGTATATVTGGTAPYAYVWSNGQTGNTATGLMSGVCYVTVTDANGCTEDASIYINEPSAITIIENIVDVSVAGGNDGSISLNVYGGTPGYTYSWSNGGYMQTISGLSAGTYSVTVTDANGCTAVETYTVNDGAVMLSLSGQAFNLICYNDNSGMIVLTTSGGTAPYSYLWSDGSTLENRVGLAAGTYAVTVTDATAATATDSWTVTEPTELIGSLSVTDESGVGNADGAIDLTVSGGVLPYTYVWDSGSLTEDLAGISAGTYTVTIVDANGCTVVYNETVGVVAGSNPGWTFTQTSGNHSIFIADTADITINGLPLENGDYLGVFYDSLGTLACGGYIVWQGTTTVLAAWGEDVGNDGFTANEAFTWKVWDASANAEYTASATYIPAPTMPNQGFFAVNGMSGLATLSTSATQMVDLALGWSIISTYIDPMAPAVDAVFTPVVTSTTIVKNGGGQVYWPSFGLNMIGNMIIGEGYQVKMSVAETLPITGTAIVPETTPIAIPSGWSIIGYLRSVPGDAAAMMSPVVSDITILKNGAGQVYWPGFGLNMIGNMMPGEGYQIKAMTAISLTYPANTISAKIDFSMVKPQYFDRVPATDNNMTLGIPVSAFDIAPALGSEIAVFDQNGLLVGSAVYNGNNLALPVWGNDEISETIDGLVETQTFELRQWDGFEEHSMVVDSWTEGNGQYESNSIQIVGKAHLVSTMEDAFALEQNVPNPCNVRTEISFYLPDNSDVTLTVFDVLGNAIEVIANGKYAQGTHTIEWNTAQHATGNYFYRLVANDFVDTKQMEINR